jgi:hypothetical protein
MEWIPMDVLSGRARRPEPRYSPPVALWCPYCHVSFVGSVDLVTGRFVHGTCPVGRLDLAAIRRLATEQWFWARFLDHLGGADATGHPRRTTAA